jgi:hypothetical protein
VPTPWRPDDLALWTKLPKVFINLEESDEIKLRFDIPRISQVRKEEKGQG